MITGSMFEGDENKVLMDVQADEYMRLLRYLYQFSADHFLHDIRLTWVFPDFVPIIREKKSIDHRVLQYSHDLIAAAFRYFLCPHQNPSNLPQDFDCKEYYRSIWKIYFQTEAYLLSTHDEIATAIVTAVAFQNQERGYEAEDKLNELLHLRYNDVPFEK